MADHASRFIKIIDEVRKNIREVTVHDVMPRLERGEKFHLVDVREDHEWDMSHLPRAVHIGKGVIERDIEKLIPDTNAEIILYCGGGYRSVLAAENLQKMGYTNVKSMDGGIRGWREAGFPLERG